MSLSKRLISTGGAGALVPSDNFSIITYTGTKSNQSTNSLSSQLGTVDFAPDWVWIKGRSYADFHAIYDSIRGIRNIGTNSTNQEGTNTTLLTSFNSNGFSLGTDDANFVNKSGETYVAWCWRAAASNATNNDGSEASTIRANPAAGFSIVKSTTTGSDYTVGHGLGVRPKIVINKNVSRSDASYGPWWVWIEGVTGVNGDYSALNATIAKQAFSDQFTTSTTIKYLTAFQAPSASDTIISYAFADVPGYQKIGAYTGDGGTNNQISTGFQPRFLIIKLLSASGQNWYIMDDKRENTSVEKSLSANLTSSEDSLSNHLDFTSTGFTLTKNSGAFNSSGENYLYWAIA